MRSLFAEAFEHGLELGDLFFFLCGIAAFKSLAHTVVDVGGEHFCIDGAKERLCGKELVGDVDAVAVFFDHADEAVDLSAGGFEQAGDLGFVGLHFPSPCAGDQASTPLKVKPRSVMVF